MLNNSIPAHYFKTPLSNHFILMQVVNWNRLDNTFGESWKKTNMKHIKKKNSISHLESASKDGRETFHL